MKENNFFIFDNEIGRVRYSCASVAHFFLNIFYKCLMNVVHPRAVKNKKYFVSVCAIFRNEAQYLEEWIEFNKLAGIEHFYLYNNFSDDNYMEVLASYIERGEVTLTEWPIEQGQMAAYKDCSIKYSDETNWIAYIDLDEFIVPNKADSISDLLKPYTKNRPAVIMYWKLFGTSGLMDRDENSLITESFVACWRKHTNIGKCIINTAYDYAGDLPENTHMHNHVCRWKKLKLPAINFSGNIIKCNVDRVGSSTFPIQLNHYFTKSYSEYMNKASRGDAFFEINPRDESYFYEHEMKCQSVDYSAYKYLIKLKREMAK